MNNFISHRISNMYLFIFLYFDFITCEAVRDVNYSFYISYQSLYVIFKIYCAKRMVLEVKCKYMLFHHTVHNCILFLISHIYLHCQCLESEIDKYIFFEFSRDLFPLFKSSMLSLAMIHSFLRQEENTGFGNILRCFNQNTSQKENSVLFLIDETSHDSKQFCECHLFLIHYVLCINNLLPFPYM